MSIRSNDATSVAKRITRKLCLVENLHWHQLLQYEESICEPEKSWSYRGWVKFLLNLGMNEEQIFNLAVRRIDGLKASNSSRKSCVILAA